MARYTFAVCIRCGVQSPPIIGQNVSRLLKDMGWVVDEGKFIVRAVCPECHAKEN